MSQPRLPIISFAAVVLASASLAQAPVPVPGPAVISSMDPLSDASDLLKHLYGKVVTYEGPVWVWSGELEPQPGRDPGLKWALRARRQSLIMPADTGLEPNLAVMLEKTLQAYHQQQTSGPRFQVLTSKWGYHIVPAQVHDENGALVPAMNLLDAHITVPEVERNPEAHLRALAAAVTGATGVLLDPAWYGNGFDRLFHSSPARFTWGASDMVARDALIDLLQRSATTFLWRLQCQPSARPEDRFCALNMSMLEVSVTDAQGNPGTRVLKFDRCGDCPPPLPPPPVSGPPRR